MWLGASGMPKKKKIKKGCRSSRKSGLWSGVPACQNWKNPKKDAVRRVNLAYDQVPRHAKNEKSQKKDAACHVNPAYDRVPRHAKTEKNQKRMPLAV